MRAPEGFTEYVLARQAALLRTAYLLTGSTHDAEDLVQVTLTKVVPHWSRISEDPEPYVRATMVRTNVSRWRRRRWREIASDDLPEAAFVSADAEGAIAVRAALASLSPRQRAVLVLRYYEGYTEAEAASVLGIAVGTAKSHARDGLSRLRTLLPVDV